MKLTRKLEFFLVANTSFKLSLLIEDRFMENSIVKYQDQDNNISAVLKILKVDHENEQYKVQYMDREDIGEVDFDYQDKLSLWEPPKDDPRNTAYWKWGNVLGYGENVDNGSPSNIVQASSNDSLVNDDDLLSTQFSNLNINELKHANEKTAIKIQSNVRGYLARKKHKENEKTAIKIQSNVRGYLARNKYKQKLEAERMRRQYHEMRAKDKNEVQLIVGKIGDTALHFLRRLNLISRVKEIILVPVLESQSPHVLAKKAEWAAMEEARRAALAARLAEEAKKKALLDGKSYLPPDKVKEQKMKDDNSSATSAPTSKADLDAASKEKPKTELHIKYIYVALANGHVQSYGLGFS